MGHGASVIKENVENNIKALNPNNIKEDLQQRIQALDPNSPDPAYKAAADGTAFYFKSPPDQPLQDPSPGDMLLAMKCLWLSELAYHLEVSETANAEQQALMVKNLHIENAQGWAPANTNSAAAITGVVAHLTPGDAANNSTGKLPFISFRGTKSVDDVEADIMSTGLGDIIVVPGAENVQVGQAVEKVQSLGQASSGFLKHYNNLLDLRKNGLDILETAFSYAVAAATPQQPPIIYLTGHGSGGAVAVLAGVVIRARHPEVIVKVVTFGCPRVFHAPSLESMKKSFLLQPGLFTHLRFVNDGKLPANSLLHCHTPVPYTPVFFEFLNSSSSSSSSSSPSPSSSSSSFYSPSSSPSSSFPHLTLNCALHIGDLVVFLGNNAPPQNVHEGDAYFYFKGNPGHGGGWVRFTNPNFDFPLP